MTPNEASDLQKLYRARRVRWARAIGRPYAEDITKPDPGALALADEENG